MHACSWCLCWAVKHKCQNAVLLVFFQRKFLFLFAMHLGVFTFTEDQKVFAITTIPVLHTNELAFNFINFKLFSNFSVSSRTCFWNHPSGSRSVIFDMDSGVLCKNLSQEEDDFFVTCDGSDGQYSTSATLVKAASANDSGRYFIDCVVEDRVKKTITLGSITLNVSSMCSLLFAYFFLFLLNK